MMFKDLIHRIKRKLVKMRLQPIRVFCFHHVSEEYNPLTMWECDWTQMGKFKDYVLRLKEKGYTFISLAEAHDKLRHDIFRMRKYIVLTADDGYKSILSILPWLEELKIPITLFVNPKYMLNDAIGDNVQIRLEQTKGVISSEKLYLSIEDIQSVSTQLITFAYHGYEHFDEWNMDENAFERNVVDCIDAMKNFPNVIPFYAHTYGHSKLENDEILCKYGLIPVYVSGNMNYNNASHIDRELISNERIGEGQV